MSEFLEIVKKADTGRVWRVLDEFMDALFLSTLPLRRATHQNRTYEYRS